MNRIHEAGVIGSSSVFVSLIAIVMGPIDNANLDKTKNYLVSTCAHNMAAAPTTVSQLPMDCWEFTPMYVDTVPVNKTDGKIYCRTSSHTDTQGNQFKNIVDYTLPRADEFIKANSISVKDMNKHQTEGYARAAAVGGMALVLTGAGLELTVGRRRRKFEKMVKEYLPEVIAMAESWIGISSDPT